MASSESLNPRNIDLSFLLPLILGLPTPDRQTGDQPPHERIVLINPATQGMIVIDSSRSLEDFIREMERKEGLPPASKASIEAMKTVVIGEEDVGSGGECSICLDGWEIGGQVREMPCKHRFHCGCIEKWLGIHGSCPVCRFKMPVDEEDEGKKATSGAGAGGEEEERAAGAGARRTEIWVTVAVTGRRSSASESETESDSGSGYGYAELD